MVRRWNLLTLDILSAVTRGEFFKRVQESHPSLLRVRPVLIIAPLLGMRGFLVTSLFLTPLPPLCWQRWSGAWRHPPPCSRPWCRQWCRWVSMPAWWRAWSRPSTCWPANSTPPFPTWSATCCRQNRRTDRGGRRAEVNAISCSTFRSIFSRWLVRWDHPEFKTKKPKWKVPREFSSFLLNCYIADWG